VIITGITTEEFSLYDAMAESCTHYPKAKVFFSGSCPSLRLFQGQLGLQRFEGNQLSGILEAIKSIQYEYLVA
jgi:hypothetical protein